MAFKVVIANTIKTRIKGAYTDHNGVEQPFDFTLEQERVSQAELEAAIKSRGEGAVAFIKRITKGWSGQRLVLMDDEAQTPAPYSSEALDVLLGIAGMGAFCWQQYLEQVTAHAKN